MLIGVLLILLPTLAHGLVVDIIVDPDSSVGAWYPVSVKVTSETVWPRHSMFAVSFYNVIVYCAYIESFSHDYFPDNCTNHKSMHMNFTMKNEELPVGSEATLFMRQVKYNAMYAPLPVSVNILAMVDGELVVIDGGVNNEGWIPANYAKVRNFTIDTFGTVYTRRMFDFNITGISEINIIAASYFTIELNHDFDGYFATYSDITVYQASSRMITGALGMHVLANDNMLIRVANFRIPATNGILTLAFSIYNTHNNSKTHLINIEIPIEPEVVYYSKNVKLIKDQKICGRGTYTLLVDPHSTPIFNPRYEITAPHNIFGDQHATVVSEEQLDKSQTLTFQLINPCSVAPLGVLDGEFFAVAVHRGDEHDEVALVLKARLGHESVYEPGRLQQLEVAPQSQGYASATAYTFLMTNDHLIPAGGQIRLTLNKLVSAQTGYMATVNSVPATSNYRDSVILIVLPNSVPASTNIEIILDALINPSLFGNYSDFSAQSFDEKGYLIDESGHASITINQPGIVTFSSAMSSTKNLDESVYTFTLSSPRLAISPNDLIGFKIPPEINAASCSLLSHALGTSPNSSYDHDYWLIIATEDASNVVEFSVSCVNPPTTARTGSFEFVVVTSGGVELARGETTVKTSEASLFRERPLLQCESACPGCSTTCSLSLKRKTNTKLKSIVFSNERLDFNRIECRYDSVFYTSSCFLLNSFESSIKLTVSDFVEADEITVTNINLIAPEHSEGAGGMRIRTYATEETEGGALAEEDEATVDPGSCLYPCKSCSRSHSECDECLESFASGQLLYLYPDGIEGCSSQTDTNCRVLQDEKCCSGYYKDELMRQCLKCASECGECEETKDHCTKCGDSKFLFRGTCQAQCEEGTFADPDSVQNKCGVCPEGCRSCTSLFDCARCSDDYVFHEVEKLCLQGCPKGRYMDGEVCKQCSADCAACEGSSKRCTECDQEKVNKYLTEDGACVDRDTCVGEGRNVLDGTNCKPCSSECGKCVNTPDSCITCKEGEFYDEVEDICVSTCPSSHYTFNGKCIRCDSRCEVCTSTTECTVCVPGAYFLPVTKECAPACPERHYEVGDECYPCGEHCERCESGEVCVSCDEGHFVASGKCHRNCPPGTFNSVGNICEDCDPSCATCEKNEHMCTECAPGHYWYRRQCVAACPSTMLALRGVCEFCSSPCRECNGAPNFCTACHGSDYLFDHTCWNACPQSTVAKLDLSHLCVACAEGCKECAWSDAESSVPTLAISCLPGYKYLNSACHSSCPNKYVATSDGLACVRGSDLNKNNRYYMFPHLVAAMVLMVVVVLARVGGKKTLATPLFVILLNYLAISSYLLCMLSLSSDHTFAKSFLVAIVGLQLVLNAVFVVLYNCLISRDEEFAAWGRNHSCAKCCVLACSTVFTFQTFRLLYSCLAGSDAFSAKFKRFQSLFSPLNSLSVFQMLFVQGTMVVFGGIELVHLTYGTFSHSFMKEAFVLSFLLLVALCFEVWTIRSAFDNLHSERLSATMNTLLNSNQANPCGADAQTQKAENFRSISGMLGSGLKSRNDLDNSKRDQLVEDSSLKEKKLVNSSNSSMTSEIAKFGCSDLSAKNLSGIIPMLGSRRKLPPIRIRGSKNDSHVSAATEDGADKQRSTEQSKGLQSRTKLVVTGRFKHNQPHSSNPSVGRSFNAHTESKEEASLGRKEPEKRQEPRAAVLESLPEQEDAASHSLADASDSSSVSNSDTNKNA